MTEQRVVVVDRYGGLHQLVGDALTGTAYRAHRVAPAELGKGGGLDGDPALTIINLCLPADELTVVRKRASDCVGAMLVVSGCGPMAVAASILIPGADRYVTLPVDPAVLRQLVLALAEPEDAVHTPAPFHGMVGRSAAFRTLTSAIEQVAATDSTVLLIGETGTGKEMAARAIHELSGRSGAFVAVDCGALPEGLIESELFGHVQGAFTGATSSRRGLFEAASRGTLFLDQIDDLSPAVQMKLLRAIQEREIRPVGSVRRVPVSARLVAASRSDLEEEVEAGRFREDLFYRLKVFPMRVPPLRQRREDIPLLIDYALRRHGRTPGQDCSWLARQILRSYDWPGNVRQLLAVIESSAIRAGGTLIDASHLPLDLLDDWRDRASTPATEPDPATLEAVLEEAGGNRTRAAELLGISRTTLWRRMKEREGSDGRGDERAL